MGDKKTEPKGEQERRRTEGEGKKRKVWDAKRDGEKKGATIGGAGEGKGRGVRGE